MLTRRNLDALGGQRRRVSKLAQVFFSNYLKFMGLAEVAIWMTRLDVAKLFVNVVGLTKGVNDAYSSKPTATA